jgi:malonyl-CoA O-methyltransferase
MSVKNEFSKHANSYNSYNIIQQLAAKALVRDIAITPKRILELGCGSGQIYKYISKNFDIHYYKAVDFSQSMCNLHPKDKNIEVLCHDFDDEDFLNLLQQDSYDMVISSSALQWANNLSSILKTIAHITPYFYASLFTSNTFKTIQKITQKPSPILSLQTIEKEFLNYFDATFEVINYKLEFDDKKTMFDYIKKSGVSGNANLSFKEAKELYKRYDLNYLEFEVVFITAFSKSYNS